MEEFKKISEEIKNYSTSDLYSVYRDVADLLHFSLLYLSNDICEDDDLKHQSLLQMYSLANELMLIIEKITMQEIEDNSMKSSYMENAFRIYTLKDKNYINSRKICSKIFDEKLLDEQITKINREFEMLEKNISELEVK